MIRRVPGWTMLRVLDQATSIAPFYWWDHAGKALKIPILDTRLQLTGPVDSDQRDILIAACVDIAIGLRLYIKEMK